jgi:hypothetical protein
MNHLNGARALIFARTRKGDNDYERARRQQLLVAAAVAKVKSQGLAAVPALISLARGGGVRTDLQLASVGAIFEIVAKADLGTGKRAVLGPRTYATGIPGTTSNQLRLGVVRRLIDAWMPAVKPSPSPSPMPTASGSPAAGSPGPGDLGYSGGGAAGSSPSKAP